MRYLKLDKKVKIERYTVNRYLLCVYGDFEKRIINDTAYEIIIRFDGSRDYESIIEELIDLYQERKENVESIVNEFINELREKNGINVVALDEIDIEPIEVVGETTYYPQAASIEITEKCNLKCLHCYGGFGDGCSHEMKIEDVKKIMKELSDLGVKTLELTGGDVSTYKELSKVIQYALELSFVKINVLTNGIILNEDVVELIINNKDRIEVQIDLHSLNDEYLAWFTGANNTVERIKSRINKFVQSGVEMRIATIFTRRNLDEFNDIAKWVAGNGVKWGIGLVERLGRAIISDKDLYLAVEDIYKFQSMIEEANKLYPGMISYIDYQPNDNNCGAMTTHVVINSHGYIKLCTMDDRSYFNNDLGNCISESVKVIYDRNINLIKSLSYYSLPNESNEECEKCSQFYACAHCLLRHLINIKEREYKCRWCKENMSEEIKKHFFNM